MHIPPRFLLCRWLVLTCSLSLSSFCLHADVKLPSLISDHVVLQKSARTKIWGKADPGEKVAISLVDARGEATADADGNWRIELDLSRMNIGPFDLIVEGKNKVVVRDVLVGDVWVASGQSNMELSLKSTNGAAEQIAASANPLLRQFLVKKATSAVPLDSCQGEWTVAGPVSSGNFSATAYYFGKMVQQETGIPIGLMNVSWGGTSLIPWTSRGALDSDPELKEGVARMEARLLSYPQQMKEYLSALMGWQVKYSRNDRPSSGMPSDEGWSPVILPGKLPVTGAVWLRRVVPISHDLVGKDLPLNFALIDGVEQVYWDGIRIGEATPEKNAQLSERCYKVPAAEVKEGNRVLALRIFSPTERLAVDPYFTNLSAGPVSLVGEWQAKPEFVLPFLSEQARVELPKSPGKQPVPWQAPAYLFNAMIHPILPNVIKGVIWYQGENNAGRAFQYRREFPAMISDWRRQWNQGDFPFYFCQLANYTAKSSEPGDSGWAELRESQSLTLSLPNTGQAVLIDIGESADIHPRNKKDVGERLARIALAKDYGREIAYSGPIYKSLTIKDGKACLIFSDNGGGLVAKPVPSTYVVKSMSKETAPTLRRSPTSQLEGFSICGEDKKWVWADAEIKGEMVIVWSNKVPQPLAVRYGWQNNPTCNLYNVAGLPAVPFRTDNFSCITEKAKF